MLEYKISFCTVCMNRLHHLQQTLPINIFNNNQYKKLEFILLDYNSSDGLEEYVQEFLKEYITCGKLIYYKTNTPDYFNRSHSRNLAYKLASGDLICNIDADNYTGENFAAYINSEFKKDSNIFLTPLGVSGINNKKDVFGRTCVKKSDFYKIRGYDERIVNYGYEDYDFLNRLELIGLKRTPIATDQNYLSAITHVEEERLSNERTFKNFHSLFLNYLSPSSTDFLFLFKDNTYKRGIYIDNKAFKHVEPLTNLKQVELRYNNTILQEQWIEGKWSKNKDKLILKTSNNLKEEIYFNSDKNCFSLNSYGTCDFYKILDYELIRTAIMMLSQVTNMIIMEKNKLEKIASVNKEGFGNDIVYKNFNQKEPQVVD
jgi:predicted glycosyltransferase involved in capsule biosynthesis